MNDKNILSLNIDIGYPLEILIKEPKKESDKICLFVNGLNADKMIIKYLNNECFDDKYLVTFNHRQWNDNTKKATKKPSTYVNDVLKIVNVLKEKYPNKKIYLLGESWGAGLVVLFTNKYSSLIEKSICWNMPYGIQKVDNKNEKNKLLMSLKMICTFLFNIETKSNCFFPKELTNNKLLARTISIKNISKKSSNKIIIATWKTINKGWKVINKNLDKLDLIYVQGLKDIMISQKQVQKLETKYPNLKNDKFYFLEEGTHILTMDVIEANNLFNIIQNNI